MMGNRSPTVVCTSVLIPPTKKVVLTNTAVSRRSAPISRDSKIGIATAAPIMVKKC